MDFRHIALLDFLTNSFINIVLKHLGWIQNLSC